MKPPRSRSRNPWTPSGWTMATAEITSPEGQRIWSWSAGILDDHEFEPQTEEQIEEGLLRAAESALATADVEPGDVLTLRIGGSERVRLVEHGPGGALVLADRPLAANPYRTCPSCGAGVKESAETCWRCNWEFASRDKPTFGRVARGRLGVAANPKSLDFEGDPAGTRERFRRLAEKKVRKRRAMGLRPTADPEDAAQAAMLGELEARRRGMSARKVAAYRALEDEIDRSSSIAETSSHVVRETLRAIKAKRDRDFGPGPEAAERTARTFRRRRIGSSLPAPEERRSDPFLVQRLERAMEMLPFKEREIIRLRFGIGDGSLYTLEEVARIFDTNRESIRLAEARALDRLSRLMSR